MKYYSFHWSPFQPPAICSTKAQAEALREQIQKVYAKKLRRKIDEIREYEFDTVKNFFGN